MKILRTEPALRVAAVLALASLVFMSVGVLVPKPLAVIAATSIGQGLGILGAGIFGFVVLRDIRHVFRRRAASPPPPPSERVASPSRRGGSLAPPSRSKTPPAPTAADVDFDDDKP